MCMHLENKKISFRRYAAARLNNKIIYYYCDECRKLFVATKCYEPAIGNMIIIFIIYAFIVLTERIFNFPLFVEVIVMIICILIITFLQLYLDWKTLSYEEIDLNKSTKDS